MTYDFDTIISRKNTNSVKHDLAGAFGMPPDALPMWVADMDFPVPPGVTERILEAARHGIYGYSEPGPAYFAAVQKWFAGRFGFETKPGWLVKTPGVVMAVAMAVRAFTAPGDGVIIQEPVYHPFKAVIEANGRRAVVSELRLEGGRYDIDFGEFEGKIAAGGAKLFILCSPHNPVGRVWRPEELRCLAGICRRHGVLVVSDEIHCDFTYGGRRHCPFLVAAPEMRDCAVVCTAPSKTFNLAGLQASNIFIPNGALRAKFQAELARAGYGGLNAMGLVACQAAYETGAAWLGELRAYLAGNLAAVREFARATAPRVGLVEPEGTYLAWLDFRALPVAPRDLNKFLAEKAKVWLDDGLKFGASGAGFQRLNMACPRAVLQKALGQMAAAIDRL